MTRGDVLIGAGLVVLVWRAHGGAAWVLIGSALIIAGAWIAR